MLFPAPAREPVRYSYRA